MKTKTNTKITVESSRRTIIRLRRPDRKVGWCKQYATETEMLATAEAAIIFGITQLVVFRLIENSELHFIETASGALLICCSALKNKNYKTKGV